MTRLRDGEFGDQIRAVANIHLFSKMSRQVLGHTRPQIQWVHDLFPVGKAARAPSWPFSSIYCQREEWVECTSVPPIRLHCVDSKNITFLDLHELANYQDRHVATTGKRKSNVTFWINWQQTNILHWICRCRWEDNIKVKRWKEGTRTGRIQLAQDMVDRQLLQTLWRTFGWNRSGDDALAKWVTVSFPTKISIPWRMVVRNFLTVSKEIWCLGIWDFIAGNTRIQPWRISCNLYCITSTEVWNEYVGSDITEWINLKLVAWSLHLKKMHHSNVQCRQYPEENKHMDGFQ